MCKLCLLLLFSLAVIVSYASILLESAVIRLSEVGRGNVLVE
ncbi:hypothetical protein SAMN05421780_101698 [Flexibacter flexilis DSM 6793]|uniref:Uncharacterized protein n=1 Tax=Flexibacter flexilis DSM 6793 TaxID=927664 RepID=A0A1I1E9B2_9BACT|nr:hypothetical protein SAMN05421780_101698 [Flexibacter flexilis DSM 6793]